MMKLKSVFCVVDLNNMKTKNSLKINKNNIQKAENRLREVFYLFELMWESVEFIPISCPDIEVMYFVRIFSRGRSLCT